MGIGYAGPISCNCIQDRSGESLPFYSCTCAVFGFPEAPSSFKWPLVHSAVSFFCFLGSHITGGSLLKLPRQTSHRISFEYVNVCLYIGIYYVRVLPHKTITIAEIPGSRKRQASLLLNWSCWLAGRLSHSSTNWLISND